VLLALIENSVQAQGTEMNGWIRLSIAEDSDNVMLAIEDSGPGVPLVVRDKIMQPFFTTKGVGNAGLGLSIAVGILQHHGGYLRLDHTAPFTRFVFSIPKIRNKSSPQAA
jgi:signal transduction histidine kinase